MRAFLRWLFAPFWRPRAPWAVIVRTYEEDGGGMIAVLDCGHEICIDYRTPAFRCPLCRDGVR